MSSEVVTYRTSPVIRNVPFPRTPWWRRLRLWALWRMVKRRRKREEIERTRQRACSLIFSYQLAETVVDFDWSPLYKKYTVSISFGETWWGYQIDPIAVLEHHADHLLASIKKRIDEEVHKLHEALRYVIKDAPDHAFSSRAFLEKIKKEVRAAKKRKEICYCLTPFKEKS